MLSLFVLVHLLCQQLAQVAMHLHFSLSELQPTSEQHFGIQRQRSGVVPACHLGRSLELACSVAQPLLVYSNNPANTTKSAHSAVQDLHTIWVVIGGTVPRWCWCGVVWVWCWCWCWCWCGVVWCDVGVVWCGVVWCCSL